VLIGWRRLRWALPAVLSAVTGCVGRAPPPDYFLLQPLAPEPAETMAIPAAPTIGVGPIRFPHYLDRPQMVVALPGGQLRLRDDQRWADNLRENFTRVFAEDLAAHTPLDRVLVHPWARTETVDFKLAMRVNTFHLTEAGTAVLDVRWDLYRREGLVLSRRSRLSSQADPNAPAVGVVALSRTVDALSRACAAAIRQVARGSEPPDRSSD